MNRKNWQLVAAACLLLGLSSFFMGPNYIGVALGLAAAYTSYQASLKED